MLQDFVSTPPLRSRDQRKTTKLGCCRRGCGQVGTPRSYAAFNQIGDIVKHGRHWNAPDGEPHRPAGDRRRPHRSLAIGTGFRSSWPSPFWCSSFCYWSYRSAVTMLLPLVTIGLSLVIAQAVGAGYSQLTGAASRTNPSYF